MKRFVVFLSIFALFFCLVPISAHAAESYTLDFTDRYQVYSGGNLSEGWYSLTLDLSTSQHGDILYTFEPFYVTFDSVSDISSNPLFRIRLIADFVNDLRYPFWDFVVELNGSTQTIYKFEDVTGAVDFRSFASDAVVTLTAVDDPSLSAGPSLSGIVDSGMMSGVLDQVVSILPVVLVVIIGFIAIRKGISFLRGFLAGS